MYLVRIGDRVGGKLMGCDRSTSIECQQVYSVSGGGARSHKTDRSYVNVLLVEVFVLITIGWAIALYWATRKWLRQRMAWQWWQQQQVLQAHHKAESIRDGLLQQTFAFRRYLEAEAEAIATQPKAKQTSHWLEQFQTFYQALESLSNELSSPFVADSLPLALQFALKDWQRSHPQTTLQLNLPANWIEPEVSSLDQNQTILSIVIELLTLIVPTDSAGQHLQIALGREGSDHTLRLRLTGDEAQTTYEAAVQLKIQHLKEIFHSLTAGRLEIKEEGRGLTSRFSWRNRPAVSSQNN
ncbi:MAG: hypothetical protein WA885_04375 [Phormidesmis sp.]